MTAPAARWRIGRAESVGTWRGGGEAVLIVGELTRWTYSSFQMGNNAKTGRISYDIKLENKITNTPQIV